MRNFYKNLAGQESAEGAKITNGYIFVSGHSTTTAAIDAANNMWSLQQDRFYIYIEKKTRRVFRDTDVCVLDRHTRFLESYNFEYVW